MKTNTVSPRYPDTNAGVKLLSRLPDLDTLPNPAIMDPAQLEQFVKEKTSTFYKPDLKKSFPKASEAEIQEVLDRLAPTNLDYVKKIIKNPPFIDNAKIQSAEFYEKQTLKMKTELIKHKAELKLVYEASIEELKQKYTGVKKPIYNKFNIYNMPGNYYKNPEQQVIINNI
jgi:hypothetical protein